MYKKSVKNTLMSVTIITALFPSVNYAAQEYSFGIVPQAAGSKLSKLWSPILQYLEENSQIDLRFATTRNINTFEKRIHSNMFHIVNNMDMLPLPRRKRKD